MSAPRTLAVIGTAGRGKGAPLSRILWERMLSDARGRVRLTDRLVSGGAAWADHLAVAMYVEGRVAALQLHLPAPLTGRFEGGYGTAGGAANYYHDLFTRITGVDGRSDIFRAVTLGARCDFQPVGPGYGAMFARNALVAGDATEVLAYTFGLGPEPADGGTLHTWRLIGGLRVHVSLGPLAS